MAAGGQVTCPGRDRVDKSARQGMLPPYKDGAPVNIKVGLLRLGDIDIVRVNAEVYNDIWRNLQRPHAQPQGYDDDLGQWRGQFRLCLFRRGEYALTSSDQLAAEAGMRRSRYYRRGVGDGGGRGQIELLWQTNPPTKMPPVTANACARAS